MKMVPEPMHNTSTPRLHRGISDDSSREYNGAQVEIFVFGQIGRSSTFQLKERERVYIQGGQSPKQKRLKLTA